MPTGVLGGLGARVRSAVRILCVVLGGVGLALALSTVHPRHAAALTLSPSVESVIAPATNLVARVTDAALPVVAPAPPPATIPALVTGATTPVEDALAPAVNTVGQVTTPATNAVAPVVSPIPAPVAPVVAPVVDTITPVITPVVAPVAPAVTPVVAPVVDTITPDVTPVVAPVAPLVDAVGPVVAPSVDTVAPVLGPVVAPSEPAAPASSTSPLAVSPRGSVPTSTPGVTAAQPESRIVDRAPTFTPTVVPSTAAPISRASLASCVDSPGVGSPGCSASRSPKLPASPSPVPVLLIEPASSPALSVPDGPARALDGGRSFPGSFAGLLAVLLALGAAAGLATERLRYATTRFHSRNVSSY
jgi:hypothetical protein